MRDMNKEEVVQTGKQMSKTRRIGIIMRLKLKPTIIFTHTKTIFGLYYMCCLSRIILPSYMLSLSGNESTLAASDVYDKD